MELNSIQPFKIENIPEKFYSVATGKPFDHCINCERDLLADDIPYVIEKAIKRYPNFNTEDTIFEHAMCVDCQFQLRNSLSLESRQRIEAYMTKKVNFEKRRVNLVNKQKPELQEWLSKCIIKDTSIEQESEYQLYCQCEGHKIYYAYMPFMISGSAMEEIQKLLSPQTRDEIDRFMGEFFGLPPELRPLDQPLLIF